MLTVYWRLRWNACLGNLPLVYDHVVPNVGLQVDNSP